tara:strand:- start:908 stop:2551 length:1644 start_codon:yes stop_codon:yes gene_type:complete
MEIDFDNLNKNQSNLLNQVYVNNKKDYVDFLKKNHFQDNIYLLSNFFSKDIYSNLSYIGFCQIKFLKEIIKNNKQNINIITSNYYLFKNLKINFFKNKKIHFECKNYWKSNLEIYFKILYRFFYLIYFIFWEIFNKSSNRAFSVKKYKSINLLDTTFTSSCFRNSNFKDRYYDNLIKKDKNYVLCPENLLFNQTSKCLKIINKKKINCIFRFDFIKTQNYLCSLKKVIFTKFLRYKYIKNYNLSYLIFHDNLNNVCNFNFFIGILNYFFFKNLSESKIGINKIFNKFENQSAGKGFILGAKKYFPKVKIIGVSDYFINYNFGFSRIPLRHESFNNLTPNENILVNKSYRKKFSMFDKTINVKYGSFRYKKYKSLNKGKKILQIKKEVNVAVLLPIEKNQTKRIINQIQSIHIDDKNYKYKFYLKFHPNFNLKFVNNFSNSLQKNIFIWHEDFKKILNKSHLTIIGSSSASIESILYLKPVLCPMNSFFIYDSPLINLVPKKLYSTYSNNGDLMRKIDIYVKLLSNKKHIKSLEKLFFKANKKIIKDL